MSKTALTTQVESISKTLSIGGDPAELVSTLKATAFRGQNITDAQMTALLIVANEHKLNPWTNEIYAFPQNGGIQPIIGIDGWLKLANNHPQFDGIEYDYNFNDKGELLAITCKVYRKDRSRPMEATELMFENKRGTTPWKQYPSRMLKHRATAQAIRSAFSFSGVMLEDEAEAMQDSKSFKEVAQESNVDTTHIVKALEIAAESGKETFADAWQSLDDAEKNAVGMTEFKRIRSMIVINAEFSEVQDGQ